MLCLFASEIGSLVGMNNFVTVEDAIAKVGARNTSKSRVAPLSKKEQCVKRARQELKASTVDTIRDNTETAVRNVRTRYSVVESLITGDDVSTELAVQLPVAELVQLRRAVENATDVSSVEAVLRSTSAVDVPELDVSTVLAASETLLSECAGGEVVVAAAADATEGC